MERTPTSLPSNAKALCSPDSPDGLILYRRRLIPEECVSLPDDRILLPLINCFSAFTATGLMSCLRQ